MELKNYLYNRIIPSLKEGNWKEFIEALLLYCENSFYPLLNQDGYPESFTIPKNYLKVVTSSAIQTIDGKTFEKDGSIIIGDKKFYLVKSVITFPYPVRLTTDSYFFVNSTFSKDAIIQGNLMGLVEDPNSGLKCEVKSFHPNDIDLTPEDVNYLPKAVKSYYSLMLLKSIYNFDLFFGTGSGYPSFITLITYEKHIENYTILSSNSIYIFKSSDFLNQGCYLLFAFRTSSHVTSTVRRPVLSVQNDVVFVSDVPDTSGDNFVSLSFERFSNVAYTLSPEKINKYKYNCDNAYITKILEELPQLSYNEINKVTE